MAEIRRFAIAFLLLVTVSSAFAQKPATQPAPRPNIVLFLADDLTWNDCGPYGSTDVHTPNLDKLATESLKFERAFAASPTCTPSRSALYSGLYPFRNGAHANHSLVKDGLRTLPHYMKDLGYRVVLAGKSHIGPREEFPFEYLENSNVMPPGKTELLWIDLNTGAIDQMLQSHDKSQPICLIAAAHSPHVFWLPNEHYDPATIKLPPYFVDTKRTRQVRCDYYTDVEWMDKQVGEVRDALVRHGYADNTLFMFTADQGAQWPFAKWNLYDAGIRTPLLVHWPGKVDKAATTRAMVSLIDLLPTMIEAAGGTAPAGIDGKSILPVLLGKTDRHRDEVFASHTGDQAMNHAPMRCIRTDRYKYIANLAPEIPFTTHISKTGGPDGYWQTWLNRAKNNPHAAELVRRYEHRPPEELYDLEADPSELKNIAMDPASTRSFAISARR